MKAIRNSRSFRRTLLAAVALQALAASAGAATYDWTSGTFVGGVTAPNPLGAGDVLNVIGGSGKYVNSAISSQGTVNAYDDLYFQNGNVVSSSGLFDFKADAGFYDGGYNGGFSNTGIFRKSAGSGTSAVNIAGFTSNGTIDTQTGTLLFAAGANFDAGSQFTGAGSTVINNGAGFSGALTSANLTLAGGSFNGNAAAINGIVKFTAGTLTGSWSVNAAQTLALNGGSGKYLNGSLTNRGTVAAGDDFYFQNGNTLTNQGVYDLQGDVGLYDGGYNGYLANTGTLRKSAGSGTSAVSIAGFSNSGTVEVQSGTILFNTGAVFNSGSQFKGPGQVVINNGASFNGGFTTDGNLTLAGGVYSGNGAQLQGDVAWTAGRLDGDWKVLSGRTLKLATGSGKYVNATVSNLGTIAALDDLYFNNGNTLLNAGLYDLKGDMGLYDGGYNGYFVNSGTLRKSAGTGTSAVSIGGFSNTGVIEVQVGTLLFNTGAIFNNGSQFKGPGQVVINSGATFNGSFTTEANLTLAGGVFTGTAARINGNTTWTAGRLDGDWTVLSGRTLTLNAGSGKYINASVTNQGTVAATDDLYFTNGSTVVNAGLYVLKGNVGLYDGGYNGYFANSGTLRKSAGAGTSYVGIGGFSNTGTIEVQTGILNFISGAVFNAGSQFKGPGQTVISGGAGFNDAFTTDGHLTLAAGTYTGSSAQMQGAVTWTAGRFEGGWELAAGQTLTVAAGSGKYMNASFTNKGRIAAGDDVYLTNGNTLTNQGRYELQGDVGVDDGGYGGYFVNSGTLVKTAGAGVSSVAGITFSNTGVVDVQTGTLRLPSNFSNAGTLKGVGTLATNALTNAGHVAPGESVGTLTIDGSFAQTAGGSFDVELGGLAGADLLHITGGAALGGTLALSCYGACTYAVGTTIIVLDALGGVSGTFAGSPVLTGFAAGAFSVSYLTDKVVLTVTQGTVAAVPEPGTWALMLAGAACLGALAARRRRDLRD